MARMAALFAMLCVSIVSAYIYTMLEHDVSLLAKNIYFHQGETNTHLGKKAITAVVFNRMTDPTHNFGNRNVEGVVTFRYDPTRRDCDFSWYCDGKTDTPKDTTRYANDRRLAWRWYLEYQLGLFEDPTVGATWFLAKEATFPTSWPPLTDAEMFGRYRFYRF
jgi:N-acetylmuramoyl-L-alanine amidase